MGDFFTPTSSPTFTTREGLACAPLMVTRPFLQASAARTLILLKPSTYMNLSGNAVRYWMNEMKIPVERVLVVVDDLSLPFGQLRLKPGGSDGGHNGLKHIASVLGTQKYARLRFGIGNDFPRGGQVDYVLGEFGEEDLKTMDERLKLAGEAVKTFCLAGINVAGVQYSKTYVVTGAGIFITNITQTYYQIIHCVRS